MTRFEQSIFIITTLNGKMLRIRLVTRLLLDSHLFTQRHMYQKGVERLTTYWVSHIYSICWKIQTRINHTWGLRDGRCNSVSPGGGVSLYNGLYGKDPPERALFFRASDVWKGWDFTSWNIPKGREISDSSPVVSKLSLLINYLLGKRLGYARVIPFVKEPVLVFHTEY